MRYAYLAGIGIGAILVAAIAVAAPMARAVPSWAVVDAASATEQNDNVTNLTIDASDDIPRRTSVAPDAVAGFAFADLETGKVLVATIHPTFRDSAQNPDSWHLHAAQLAAGENGHDFCIDSFFPNPTGGISIQGDQMSINVRNSVMPFTVAEIDGAVGFVVNPEAACGGTGLAVDVTDEPVGLS